MLKNHCELISKINRSKIDEYLHDLEIEHIITDKEICTEKYLQGLSTIFYKNTELLQSYENGIQVSIINLKKS